MKILNLYAGIGGNRKLWEGHEVTSVEYEPYIAEAYQKLFPDDTVVIADAHQYLLDHFREFDFIWSSPPCPSHSKTNLFLHSMGHVRYPDMSLYQEIIFLRHFFKGKWVVENVIPYYKPLMEPTVTIDRHHFWSNFYIPPLQTNRDFNVSKATEAELAAYHGIHIKATRANRKMLRNAVHPELGRHILSGAEKETKQLALLD